MTTISNFDETYTKENRLDYDTLYNIFNAKAGDIVTFGPFDWIVMGIKPLTLICRQLAGIFHLNYQTEEIEDDLLCFYKGINQRINNIFSKEELELLVDIKEDRFQTREFKNAEIRTKFFFPAEEHLILINSKELACHYAGDDLESYYYYKVFGDSAEIYLSENSPEFNSWWVLNNGGKLSVIDKNGKHITHAEWVSQDCEEQYEIRGFRPEIRFNRAALSEKLLKINK